jgi:hypothetical protein
VYIYTHTNTYTHISIYFLKLKFGRVVDEALSHASRIPRVP